MDATFAIVGAGYAGLTLAITLGRKGIPVTVYEQAPLLTEIGAGVAIAGPAVKALRNLGIDPASFGSKPVALQFRRWSDGRLISVHEIGHRYEYHVGAPYVTLHRATLQKVLLAALSDLGIPTFLDKRLTHFTQAQDHVTLHFSDGSTAQSSLLIGADGIKSTVRQSLAPEVHPVYSGEIGFRGVLPAQRLPPDLPDPDCLHIWLGPRTHCVYYGIDQGRWVNFLYVYTPEALPDWTSFTNRVPGDRSEAAALFENLGWHRTIVDSIANAEGDLHYWALMDVPFTFDTWFGGRVLCIGDAAHAPLPHQGMGAGLAIEDGYILGTLLSVDPFYDPVETFRLFTRIRYPRTARVQRWSRIAGMAYKYHEPRKIEHRDKTLHFLSERLRWIHCFDPAVVQTDLRVTQST